MQVEMLNRPSKAGVYWQQIQLPQKVNLPQLREAGKSFQLPSNPDAGIYAGMFYVDAGGQKVLLDRPALERWFAQRDVPLEMKAEFAALGEGNGVAIGIGYYLIVERDIEAAPGLQGPPVKTVFDSDGNLLAESDAYGNTWDRNRQAQMTGLGWLPAAPLAWAAAVSALGWLSNFVIGWLVRIGVVAAASWVIATIFIKAAEQILPQIFKPGGTVAKAGKNIMWGLLLVFGGLLLADRLIPRARW